MRSFVIGPIGDQNSETRRNADHLFDYVIYPVLTNSGFEVIRADRISTVASITDEIIRLVQDCELCIIDLTEANPNVFYEAGRRHETGKPYIHLLKEGQKAPFDVQGTRYVGYKDLSTTENVFEAQKGLRGFLEVIARTGFGASKSANPFNNIEEGIRRIESSISHLIISNEIRGNVSHTSGELATQNNLDPLRQLMSAYESRNFRAAELALLELEEIYVDKNDVLSWAGRLARVGRKAAADLIIRYLSSDAFLPNLAGPTAGYAVPCLTRYYIVTGQANIGKPVVIRIVDSLRSSSIFQTYSGEEKAFIVNAAQSICFQVDDYETAQRYNELAHNFEPDEPVWLVNYSYTMLKRKDFVKASSLFDLVLEAFKKSERTIDPDALETGIEIYSAVGQASNVERCLQLLHLQSPDRARKARESLK